MKRLTLLTLILTSTVAWGESARELISLGNEAFKKDNFEEALTHYEEASVELPDSAQISFNRGTVYYKQEDYKKAIENFKKASLRSKEPTLASQAKFNLGNCAFRQAQRQRDSDLKKAIEHCRESISYYQEARDLDPNYQKAAENIEIVRLYVKVLLDAQKQQEDQKKEQEQEEENLITKLKKLFERQVELAQANKDLAADKPAEIDSQGIIKWQDSLTEISAKQTTLMADTKAISEEIKQTQSQLQQQAATPPDPDQPANPQQQAQMEVFSKKLEEAAGHVSDAINQEQTAINHLSSEKQNEALSAQQQAATDLSEAIKALSDDQQEQQQEGQQQQQNDNQEQDQEKEGEEKQEQEKQQSQQDGKEQKPEKEPQQSLTKMESADDILDEEKKNQKQQRPVRPGRIQRVERDW